MAPTTPETPGPNTLPKVTHLSGQNDSRGSGPAEPSPDSGQGTAVTDRMLVNAAHTLCALKRTLKNDVGYFEKELTYSAGEEMLQCYVHRELGRVEHSDDIPLLERLIQMFARDGLGTFEIVRYDRDEMIIEFSCPDSLEAFGYLSHGETQQEPSCSFTCGLLAGVGKYVFGMEDCSGPNEIVASEHSCTSTGAAVCKFVVGKRSDLEALGHIVLSVKESVSAHSLRLNDEILTRNLDLQNLNLDLERQIRRRHEELKMSEERYRALVNLSPYPIIVCLTDGTIRSLNDAALELLGYGREDKLESRNISTLLLDGVNAWERCIWLVNKEGALRAHELDFVKKTGGKVAGEVSARVSDTHPERYVNIVVRDVTERNILDERMTEARAECDFFNDLLSHDIVNYMTAAMHFLDRVRSSAGLTEDQAKSLAIIAKDVKGAYELASVVRDLSRADALGERDCRDAIDMCGTLGESVDEAKRMYADRKVDISVQKPSHNCYAQGHVLLSRVLVNLLTNAIKFDLSDVVKIEVKIEPVHHKGTDYWSVTVSDHGKGIPDHEKEKVFERYFRGDTGVSGAGLGLHVARKIVNACGGLIWAENRVKGDFTKGTVMVMLVRKVSEGQNNHTR